MNIQVIILQNKYIIKLNLLDFLSFFVIQISKNLKYKNRCVVFYV